MNMEFKRKLLIPKEVKEMYPVPEELIKIKEQRDEEIKAVFSGKRGAKRSSLMAPQIKDLALSLLWLWLLLWCGFDPWPRNFCMS